MEYKLQPTRERQKWSRLATTLLALCLPVIVATFFSGSFFKLGTLKPGEVFEAGSAHASGGHAGRQPVSPSAVNISIASGAFMPGDVTVNPGTMVTWTNNTGDRARVRDSAHNLFDSDDLNPGQSFSYTFVTPGVVSVTEERNGFTGIVRVTGTPPTGTPGTPGATTTAQPSGTAQTTSTPAAGVVNVYAMSHDVFSPADVTITTGTTVRWTNAGGEDHTSSSDTGVWNSGVLSAGQWYEFTFLQPGVYPYTCLIHGAEMSGVIRVTGPAITPTPGGSTSTPQSTPVAGTVDVTIQNFAFQPNNVTILVGSTVRWTNRDSAPHTATSDTGLFNSGTLNQNGTYSFTFNTAGTYTYHCNIHPGRQAQSRLSPPCLPQARQRQP